MKLAEIEKRCDEAEAMIDRPFAPVTLSTEDVRALVDCAKLLREVTHGLSDRGHLCHDEQIKNALGRLS